MRVWTVSDESMRALLRDLHCEEIKRWSCPCGLPTCTTYMLYGISYSAPTVQRVQWFGTRTQPPADAAMLFCVCSLAHEERGELRSFGVDCMTTIPELLQDFDALDRAAKDQVSLWVACLAAGFDDVLEEELRRMRAA